MNKSRNYNFIILIISFGTRDFYSPSPCCTSPPLYSFILLSTNLSKLFFLVSIQIFFVIFFHSFIQSNIFCTLWLPTKVIVHKYLFYFINLVDSSKKFASFCCFNSIYNRLVVLIFFVFRLSLHAYNVKKEQIVHL